jgi:26S proteasome regulatory subunit N1
MSINDASYGDDCIIRIYNFKVDENLDPKAIQVMVGQMVDTVGQSGNPRTIAGFQVHNTPVLLSAGERCELSGDEYSAYTDVLENVVIIKNNPNFRKK